MKAFPKFIFTILCLILMSTHAWSAAGWTATGSIVELNPTTAGRFLVKLDVSRNPSGCKNKQWFYADYQGTGSDHLFRMLLAAATTNNKVRVYVTGVCDLNGYSEMSSASLVP